MSKNDATDNSGLFDGLRWTRRRHLPMVLQTEASECGLAALTMIACYHGHDVDLPSLRRRYSTSLKGMTLQTLMNTAARLGFQSRPIRLDLDELSQLATPCILHWDLNHFVVLKKTHTDGATIHDPSSGVRKLSQVELSRHFTGVALECAPRLDFQPVKARETISLQALTGKINGLASVVTQIFGLALALEVITLASPFYLQWVLDQVLVSADRDLLTLLGIAFLAATFIQAAFTSARTWIITWLSTMLNVRWTTNVFSHMLYLPLDWYEKRHIGDVASRFDSLNTIQKTLTAGFVTAALDGLMAVITLAVLVVYSLKLTWIVLAAFALYAAMRFAIYAPLRRAQEAQIHYGARQQTELLEAIRGALTLKLHNQQHPRTVRYANAVVKTFNHNTNIQHLNNAFSTSRQLIFGVEKVVIIWIAAAQVIDGVFTAGMLVAFVAYADQFMNRVASLIDKIIEFRMLRLHAERLADVLLSEPEQHIETDWRGVISEATVEVCNVSFRYSSNEPWILRNCSLTIRAGESIALTGSSGCGKTTLAKIILGLLQPEEGEVRYGGVDIRRIGLGRYRSIIGTVMQEDYLFAGSIADNIACFADDETTDSQIELTSKLAAIHDDIVLMPMGYQTLIGDMGSALSGGQKQRLLLARALHRNPKLLLLDEATSHLDVDCERKINSAVNGLQMTRITIAHRPETIASAQRVVLVIDGTAQELPVVPKNKETSLSY